MTLLNLCWVAASIICCWFAWKRGEAHAPFGIYVLAYASTSAIGAVLLTYGCGVTWLQRTGANTSFFGPAPQNPSWWLLVYGPFTIVPVTLCLSSSLVRW